MVIQDVLHTRDWIMLIIYNNFKRLYFICCNFILFAATLFHLLQLYFICCYFILFAATLFYLLELFFFAACPLWTTVLITFHWQTTISFDSDNNFCSSFCRRNVSQSETKAVLVRNISVYAHTHNTIYLLIKNRV